MLKRVLRRFIVYSNKYPRDALPQFLDIFQRYDKIVEIYRNSKLVKIFKEVEQKPADLSVAYLAHSRNYIKRITNPKYGLFKHLEAELLGVGGTIAAIKYAVKYKTIAYHVGGGYHHASRGREGGFDLLNDIAIGIEDIRRTTNIRRVGIIDLDAHHPNGTEEIFYSDPDVLQVSFHTWGIFPRTGWINKIGKGKARGTKINVPLPPGTTDKPYLKALNEILIPVIEQYRPELIIYQAGVDTHHMDSLGKLKLTLNGLYERDKIVKFVAKDIPIAILAGGGYGPLSHFANANTLAAFADEEMFRKEEIKINATSNIERKVNTRILEVKKILSKHYKFNE
jgi:acetoin utilization protein AcuC